MKKIIITFFTTIFIIFSLIISPVLAVEEPFSFPEPEHAADKIVTHAVAYVDAYVKELPGFTCVFPNGYIIFFLDNGVNVRISPGCIPPLGVYRFIDFGFPDNTGYSIVLDGPVYQPPGTLNPEAMANAKGMLSEQLSKSEMRIKEVMKEPRKFNLSLESDFQKFIDLIPEYIKLKTPLPPIEVVGEFTLTPTVTIKTSPENIPEIEGDLLLFKEVSTYLDLGEGKQRTKIVRDEREPKSRIEVENVVVSTKEELRIKESKLYIEEKEVKVSPVNAISRLGLTSVEKNELKKSKEKIIYEIQGEKKAKLLKIIPVRMRLAAQINAETGVVEKIVKPWWSFLVW